jgi:hypothetical protein
MASLERLAQVFDNPYASEGQKMIAAQMIEKIMTGGPQIDPMEAARFGLSQQEFEYRKQQDAAKDNDPTSVNEYQFAVSQGEKRPYNEWLLAVKKAGATNVTATANNGEGDSALRKKLGEKEGELWASYLKTGATAGANNQSFQVLDELIQLAPQGPLTGRLAAAFPGVSSAGAAFEAVVLPIAPTLRVEGSGATSDIEYEGMLKGLPALRNKPEANKLILETMKAKNAINMERAQIVNRVSNEEISESEGRRLMEELNSRSIMTPEMKSLLAGLDAPKAPPSGAARFRYDPESGELVGVE